MALYDIVGKSLQTPVYNLLGEFTRDLYRGETFFFHQQPAVACELWGYLDSSIVAVGGRVRDVIPLSHSIPWGSPSEMATMAAEKKAAG